MTEQDLRFLEAHAGPLGFAARGDTGELLLYTAAAKERFLALTLARVHWTRADLRDRLKVVLKRMQARSGDEFSSWDEMAAAYTAEYGKDGPPVPQYAMLPDPLGWTHLFRLLYAVQPAFRGGRMLFKDSAPGTFDGIDIVRALQDLNFDFDAYAFPDDEEPDEDALELDENGVIAPYPDEFYHGYMAFFNADLY